MPFLLALLINGVNWGRFYYESIKEQCRKIDTHFLAGNVCDSYNFMLKF